MIQGDNRSDGRDAWVVFYRRTFGLATAAVLAYLIYRILEPFFGPLVWAVFLAFLLQPAQRRCTRAFRGRASAASFLLTTITLLLLVGPLTVLGGMFAAQARLLIDKVQAWTASLQISSVQDLENLPFARRVFAWLENNAAVSTEQLREWVSTGAHRALEPLAQMGGQLFLGALGTIGSFTVMLFVLFFLLRDGAEMAGAVLRLVPLPDDRKHRLVHHMKSVTRAVVFGTIATAALQGTLVGVGFALVSLPSPVVFGVAAAVLSVVPFGGTALVWVPAGLWLLFGDERVGAGVFLLVWGSLVVGLADNVVKPMLISGRAEVSTLAVFLGVLGGLAAFGFVGLFLGPLVIALATALLRFADETVGRGHVLPAAAERITEEGGTEPPAPSG
jgi:predicted PurR-regulated permease PerM